MFSIIQQNQKIILEYGREIRHLCLLLLMLIASVIFYSISLVKYADFVQYLGTNSSYIQYLLVKILLNILNIAFVIILSRKISSIFVLSGITIPVGEYVTLEVLNRQHIELVIEFNLQIDRRKLIKELNTCEGVILQKIHQNILQKNTCLTATTALLGDLHAQKFGLHRTEINNASRVRAFLLWYFSFLEFQLASILVNQRLLKIKTPLYDQFKKYERLFSGFAKTPVNKITE